MFSNFIQSLELNGRNIGVYQLCCKCRHSYLYDLLILCTEPGSSKEKKGIRFLENLMSPTPTSFVLEMSVR